MNKKKITLYAMLIMLFMAAFSLQAQAGWSTSGGKTYYIQNGSKLTGWQVIKVNGVDQKYYFSKKTGAMLTGVRKIKKKYYLFATDGRMLTGLQTVGGKTYYGKANGVLARSEWVEGTYYFNADCTMAKNTTIDGKIIGANGRVTGTVKLNGLIKQGKKTYYYIDNVKQTGFQKIGTKRYYFAASGVMKTGGWFTVGKYKYYAGKDGVLSVNKWIGKKYVLSNGAMATGWNQIGSSRYYFKSNGDYANGWTKIDKVYYSFKKGKLQTNTWVTVKKKKTYAKADGSRATGLVTINKALYYFDTKTGYMATGKVTAGKVTYWARTNGKLYAGVIFKSGKYRYYAQANGQIAKGLQKIGGKLYYFSTKNFRMSLKKKVKVNGDTYYFGADGAAVTKKWVTIKSKYYYFGSDGKMAVNTAVDGYNVNASGVRTTKVSTFTGWKTESGNKYYYVSGVPATGWKTISGSKYYFNENGVMQTGIQTISGKKYYFYPGGTMASNVTLAVGSKEYTILASGVVQSEKTINVSGTSKGAQIAKYGLNFVGNKYVYGGTSLTNGADCSGFVQTLFANYGIKLLRVADDQRKGPSAAQIRAGYKKAVTVNSSSVAAGDLIFYGSSSYASHVGVYIGNGKIVHASNSQAYPAGGIKISAWNYQTPIAIVRYWS